MTTTMKMKTTFLGLALAAVGCAPAQDPPSLIETTRVLGARVEVAGAPERATPRPGETVNVTWLVTAPGPMPPLGWAFAFCPGVSTSLDCAGLPYTVVTGQDQPRLTVDVPQAADLGDTRLLVLDGRVCASSDPVLDPASGRPRCTMDGDGTTASVAIPVDLDVAGSEPNQNPSLADSPATFDGAAWVGAGGGDPADACAGLPVVAGGTKDHVLTLGTRSADRETYTALAGDPPMPVQARERLQISEFATAGKLAHAYAWIEAEDQTQDPAAEMKWEAPKPEDVPAEGLVVQFTFVERDMRGGVDWTTRAACVTR
jgi:hypothetical protein